MLLKSSLRDWIDLRTSLFDATNDRISADDGDRGDSVGVGFFLVER